MASLFTCSKNKNTSAAAQIEHMGGAAAANEHNRVCQTEYLQSVRGILTGPSVDPTDGYLTTSDVLKRVNGVANACEWNNKTELEKKYADFQKKLSGDTKNPKLLNQLLIAIS